MQHTPHTILRVLVSITVVLAAVSCGKTDTKKSVAEVEARALVSNCGVRVPKDQQDPRTISCRVDELEHLSGTRWRAHVMGAGGEICVTFDASKYQPGTRRGQSVDFCP
jgi:hypothetical protein